MASETEHGGYLLPPMEGKDSPFPIYSRLLLEPEFEHLRDGEARVAFLLAEREVFKAGKQILGSANMPTVQGALKGVFGWALERAVGFYPDFLIILDLQFWERSGAGEREILVYHEMCHCVHLTDREGEPRWNEDGRPVWGLVAHDVEEFVATVRRYGAYSGEIMAFVGAAGGTR